MSAAITFDVLDSNWCAEETSYPRGEHVVEAPDEDLLRLIASAEAAGAVKVIDADENTAVELATHVQSQEDGETALQAAMGEWIEPETNADGTIIEIGRWSGDWHEANVAQFDLDVMSGARKPTLEAEAAE